MMGERRVVQEALFYEFSLEQYVPAEHLLRSIDRFVDLGVIRKHLRSYYSETGRPSIDPELMIWMLIIGYCSGIRSERRLMDVEATTAVRQAEVTAAKRMIERTIDRFDTWPEKLIADTGYGSAEMLA